MSKERQKAASIVNKLTAYVDLLIDSIVDFPTEETRNTKEYRDIVNQYEVAGEELERVLAEALTGL